jgi:hypothetical protein
MLWIRKRTSQNTWEPGYKLVCDSLLKTAAIRSTAKTLGNVPSQVTAHFVYFEKG